VARRGLQYAGELGKVAVGRSELEPSKRDRRFTDPAWSGNPGAATFVDEGDPRMSKVSAMAKLIASDAAMRATTEAVQVLGGNGYLKEFPAERMMRDAKVLQIYEGSNEIQHLVIARQMIAQVTAREPIWPECMPGAPGVDTGQAEPASAVATAR
jgi:alkylation response protein AidB-like acyl-CoA dehydrogenase